jgi:hypothetical protein
MGDVLVADDFKFHHEGGKTSRNRRITPCHGRGIAVIPGALKKTALHVFTN